VKWISYQALLTGGENSVVIGVSGLFFWLVLFCSHAAGQEAFGEWDYLPASFRRAKLLHGFAAKLKLTFQFCEQQHMREGEPLHFLRQPAVDALSSEPVYPCSRFSIERLLSRLSVQCSPTRFAK
jgi:hypothetical protein